MSVHNIKQLPQTRGMLVATAKKVRERVEEVQTESLALDRLETDVRVGTAAVLQSIDDEREPLDEEIGHLRSILDSVKKPTSAPAVVNPQPAPEPAAPVVVVNPEPAAPAPAVVNPEPAPEPAAPVVVVNPAPARFLDTWRNASIWARIIIILTAVIGAFIFLLVGKATAGIIRWGTGEWWLWLSTVTAVIWYAGLIVGGFGLGGWLATRWFARRR